MFRFVGLVWNSEDPTGGAVAQRLADEIEARGPWNRVLSCPGLTVFVTGARPGVNGVHQLFGQGIVLGQLFRGHHLDHAPDRADELTDDEAHRILESGGEALIDEFWGRYVALLRSSCGNTRILRDPGGALPCFLRQHEGVSIVFSWLEDLLGHLSNVSLPSINWEAVEAMALSWELGGRATALNGVTQVLPGEALDLSESGSSASLLLWNAVNIAHAPAFVDPAAAADALRDTVRYCARAWAGCYDRILLRLSGGLDSSILLSCLTPDACDSTVTCVNHHSPGSDSDERPFARLAAKKARRALVEHERDGDDRLERILDVALTPVPAHYVGGLGTSKQDAKLAATRNVGAVFTGVGGDQLFFEFARWWPAADHLRLHGFAAGFLTAAMNAARLGQVSVWDAMALAIADRTRGAASRHIERMRSTLVRADTANEASLLRLSLHPAMTPPPDLPIGKLNQTRLLLASISCYDPHERESAPDMVSPLLSQPLVELCLRLPTYILTLGGRGRGLARKAFAADIPMEIATRRSKGGINDLAKKAVLENLPFVRAMLLDGELARRHILDRAAVEHVLSERPTSVDSSIAEIHVLLEIEAWIQCHGSRARSLPHVTRFADT